MTTTPAFLSDLLALRNANPTLGIKQLTSKLKEKFSEITAKDVRENIPKDLSEEEKAARQKEIEKRQNIEIKEMQREERTRRLKEQEAREEKARAAAEVKFNAVRLDKISPPKSNRKTR